MKHFAIKFNHGVEIGARLAYLGHYRRTGDLKISQIAAEELAHQLVLEKILNSYGHEPSVVIDFIFTVIGHTVGFLCRFCPIWSLNLVARTMEVFAIMNYDDLSEIYEDWEEVFMDMAETEEQHYLYFSGKEIENLEEVV